MQRDRPSWLNFNYNPSATCRLDLIICVSNGDEIDKVKPMLAQILASDNRVMKAPAQAIGVVALGVVAAAWTRSPSRVEVT